MTSRCSVEWDTDRDDEDGDGEAEHACHLDEGHDGEWHYCCDHFACSPVHGAPAWFADEDAGTAADGAA